MTERPARFAGRRRPGRTVLAVLLTFASMLGLTAPVSAQEGDSQTIASDVLSFWLTPAGDRVVYQTREIWPHGEVKLSSAPVTGGTPTPPFSVLTSSEPFPPKRGRAAATRAVQKCHAVPRSTPPLSPQPRSRALPSSGAGVASRRRFTRAAARASKRLVIPRQAPSPAQHCMRHYTLPGSHRVASGR